MNLISPTIHKYQIDVNKISAFITYGASVMKTIVKKLNKFLVNDEKLLNEYIKKNWCISYFINLFVHIYLKENHKLIIRRFN